MKQSATQHPLFRRWTNLRQAILNPRNPDYRWAGAEGITCEGLHNFWEFAEFVETEIGLPPSPDMKLHRKNLNRDFTYGNICWATQSQMSRDTREKIKIKIGKKTKNITVWCDELNVSYWRAYRRYRKGYKGMRIFQ